MPDLLAGIDVGTSGVKAGVFDPGGKLLGLGRASHEVRSPRPGWAETDPEEWWRGVRSALREACEAGGVSPGDIGAVGLSVLFPAVMPLDADGRSLAPAILYCDRRSLVQIAGIERAVGREEFERVGGNRLAPGTCAVTSMLWLRDVKPTEYARARTLGFVNTFLGARLTGEFVTDPTHAALSGLVDIRDPWRWHGPFCERLGVDPAKLPRIAGAAEAVGAVTGSAAAETGLREGTPVVAGSGDVPASAVGAGAKVGEVAVYIAGSSDCLAVPMPRPTDDRGWMNLAYIERGEWLGNASITSSGASVEWFVREVLGKTGGEGVALMTDLASSSPPGAGGVLYLPYLQGERTPVWDPLARGAFFGLTAATTRAHMARAVFEGTAFALRQLMAPLDVLAGGRLSEVRAVGGGTRNALWNRIKADVTGRGLRVLRFQETGTLGAALLAGTGAGVYASFEEAGRVAAAAEAEPVEPNGSLRDVYDRQFDLYSKLYPRTKEIMHGLADEA